MSGYFAVLIREIVFSAGKILILLFYYLPLNRRFGLDNYLKEVKPNVWDCLLMCLY